MDRQLITRIKQFMENEARSGSMDFGCTTPLYIYRMFGGTIAMEEINGKGTGSWHEEEGRNENDYQLP